MIRMDVLLVFVYLPSTFLLRDAFADIFVRRPAERNRRFIRGASFKESAIDLNITVPTALYRIDRPVEKIQRKGACPMSPYAIYLTNNQQDVLFELITEARKVGADEQSIKQHIDEYLKQILSPQKLKEFHEANERFERERHEKRMNEGSTIRTPLKARSPINVQRHKMIPQKFVVEGQQDLNQLLRLQNRLIL